MERIYEKGLYDLDLEGILRYLGHDNNTFIGQVKREDNKFFLVNLYSDDEEQKGKLLVDLLYGDNIRVSIEKSIELDENNFYKIRIFLFLKETRLAQGTPFLFFAQIIENVQRNPYEIDVDQAFKKNDNPSSNRNLVRTLAEVGRGMYSLKDRMFFELIQNADDASSKGGVLLDVFTEGDYLIISHDGFNFDRNDFKAINSSANGTKKANENKTGYKGIGFKSVFTDSEEVFIKTGGYQFKFDKHDSRFSDFESFYFFVREINSEESRTNFLNKFADEKKEFNGVKDIPWQIVPIWVDKFPDELFPYFTKNVSIALKLGKNNIEGDKGYKKAIEEIIENPKFVLFLRNTKQILFNGGIIRKKENDNKIILENSKGNSIDTFERRNFEIKFDEKTFEKRKIDIKLTNLGRKYLTNFRDGEFTYFDLQEFLSIKSLYGKHLYRMLKQFRFTGVFTIKMTTLKKIFDIPSTYTNSRIVNDVLGRNLEEGKQLEKGYNGIRPDLASNYHPNTTIDWISSNIKPKDILKLISIFQMTYIGAPMLFYGDEAGMWGATDPYCRKPMLWDEFIYDVEKNPSKINRNEEYEQYLDKDLFQWYKKLIKMIRKSSTSSNRYGKFIF